MEIKESKECTIKRYSGTIRKVNLEGLTPMLWYLTECRIRGVKEIPILRINREVWEIIHNKEIHNIGEATIIILDKNTDGSYRYIVQFCSEDTSLNEILKKVLIHNPNIE